MKPFSWGIETASTGYQGETWREGGRKREREGKGEGEGEREKVCVSL
jgi:hypothetical protein